ncbi:MAG: hypothetical protein HY052_03795 [Proteobacteria bacterium]|nr:hypothetical protein [Pseudomonadota bacterium]
MSDENLNRLVEGLAVFNEALNDKMGQDESVGHKIAQNIQPYEKEVLQEKMHSYTILAMNHKGDEPSEDLLRLNVELTEMGVEFSLRVVSKEYVAACIPADLKNQADIGLLRNWGAYNLADLCALDLEIKPTAPTVNRPPKTFHKYKF